MRHIKIPYSPSNSHMNLWGGPFILAHAPPSAKQAVASRGARLTAASPLVPRIG